MSIRPVQRSRIEDSPGPPKRSQLRVGVIAGIAAYSIWGLFPLYWPLLEPAAPLEILANRFTWSLVVCALILTATRGWSKLLPLLRDRRVMWLLLLASVLIGTNWGVYIWAVNTRNVVEASLGYFINPLFSVALGVIVLRERLRRLQWLAVGIAALAVGVLTVGYGRPPWIAIVLALTFGSYGFVKKTVGVESLPSLTIETAYAFPFAVGYLVYLTVNDQAALFHSSTANTLLLMGCGVITTIPLLAFNASAIRVPLTTLGLLQYITPVVQFVLGITVIGETMPPTRWVGFSIVWLALCIFTYDAVRHARTQRLSVTAPV